jgi:hypothetical protein
VLSQNFAQLVNTLETTQQKMSSETSSQRERANFADELTQAICHALEFPAEVANLSEESAKAIEKYLYGCGLLVQCKDAAVRVSPEVWQGIEDRLLTIPQ